MQTDRQNFLFLSAIRNKFKIKMKKITSLLMLLSIMTFSVLTVNAQNDEPEATTEQTEENEAVTTEEDAPEAAPAENEPADEVEESTEEEASGHEVLKKKFIEGGPAFMALPLLCLILGLAIVIERIISSVLDVN